MRLILKMDSRPNSKANVTTKEQDVSQAETQPADGGETEALHSQQNESPSFPYTEEDPLVESDDLDGLVNNKLIKAEQERETTEHKKAEKKRVGDGYDEPIEIATSSVKESDKEDEGPVKTGRKLKVRFADAEPGPKKGKGKLSSKNEKRKTSRVKIKMEPVDSEDEREHHDQHVDAQEEKEHLDQPVDTQEEIGDEPVAKRRGARTRKTPERYDPSRGIGSKGDGVPPPKVGRNSGISKAKGAFLASPLQTMPPQPILPSPPQPLLPLPIPLDVVDVEATTRKESAKKESKKKKASAKEAEAEATEVVGKEEKPAESESGLVLEACVLLTGTIIDLLHEHRDDIVNMVKRSLSGGEDVTPDKVKKSRK
jgi:hypothetical protein